MRLLKRNQQDFWYAKYESVKDVMNDKGEYTGQQQVVYSEPIKGLGYITRARGSSEATQFGTNVVYDQTILMDSTDMTENSILWIGITPDKPYNYIVSRIAQSLNHVTIAIRRVEVSNYGTQTD